MRALTDAGWLAALIPTEYGGGGLGVTEASVILEEINRSGAQLRRLPRADVHHGHAAAPRLGEQKQQYLPRIASGELRLQSFAVTEPTTGTDTTKIKTVATRQGDRYIVSGQKVWISRVQHSDLMLLLARTTPLAEVRKQDRRAVGVSGRSAGCDDRGMTVRPIAQHGEPRNQRGLLRRLRSPGREPHRRRGAGFRYILDGMNAERILIAAECIGDGYWFIEKARAIRHGAASYSAGPSARTRASSSPSRARMPTCAPRT